MKKGQSSLEYLLILAIVLIVVAVVSYMLISGSDSSISSGEQGTCRATASSCKLKVLSGDTLAADFCLNECKQSCLDAENKDYITGIIGCVDGTGCHACANGLKLPTGE